MAGFGYRPPQFSEDIAWLPAWLQPHQVLFPGEQVKDAPCEDAIILEENVSDRPAEHLFLMGDARCSSFHLFLSGDSHSPVGNTPSSGNVLHFDLHLSSDDILQLPLSQSHDIVHKEKPKSNEVQSMQSIDKTSVVQDDMGCQYKLDDRTWAAELLPPSCTLGTSPTSPLQPLPTDDRKSRKIQDKFDFEGLRNADIDDAVELSIAASEALAISELMNSGLPSDILPAAAILEVALRVKQARNECCLYEFEDGFAHVDDDANENDRLSDLDEGSMADAFEDVGLSVLEVVATPDYLCDGDQRTSRQEYHTHSLHTDSSYVPNTHFSDSCDQVQNTEIMSQNVDFTGIPSQNKLGGVSSMKLISKESPLKSQDVQRKKPCNDEPFLGSNASTIESHLDACAHRSAQITANDTAPTQIAYKDNMKGVESDVEGMKLFHTQSNTVSSQWIGDSRKADVENAVNGVVAERFRSRWLGGWATKGFEGTVHGSRKNIPKIFNRETSFLSESVDVVMDESSVQKPEIVPKKVPSSSISIEGIYQNTSTGISLSQDLVGSSNFSLPDPLCSVVPCSIPLDNAHVDQTSCQISFEEEAGKFFNPVTVANAELTIPSVPFVCGEEHVTSKTSGECSKVSRKQLSSLKSYSMVVSATYGGLEGEVLYKNEATTLEHAGKRNTSKPILESMVEKKTQTENEDIEVQVHQCEESYSPLMLNYGTRRRISACDVIVSDTEESSKQALISSARKTQLDNCRSEVTFRDQTKVTSFAPLDSSLCSRLHDKESLTNKRVRFSETEVKCHQDSTGQKLPSRYLTRSHSRTSKRVKDSSIGSKFGARKENRNCLTRFHNKYGKGMLFQDLEFLLTGFSSWKRKELETLIRKHGGDVLSDIPLPSPYLRRKIESRCKNQQLPIVLSPKKVQTTKFLYGCAINTLLLKTSWLTNSVVAGSLLPPGKYLILSNQAANRKRTQIGQPVHCSNYIFDKVGIMFYGKPSFCSKLGKIVKHGGGQVFKTLQWLVQSLKNGKNSVGAVVVENESAVSRHLRHCASEQRLQMMPASWIINSLHSGKLFPFKNERSAPLRANKMLEFPTDIDMSEEI